VWDFDLSLRPDYSNALVLLGGLSGIALYAEAVRVGLRDKGYAIPVWVIGLNFSWAVIHTLLVGKIEGSSLPVVITAARLVLDIAVLYTWFKFGPRHFPENPGERWFVPWSLLVIVVSFVLPSAFIMQFGDYPGLAYTAFMQNLAMSLLFIGSLSCLFDLIYIALLSKAKPYEKNQQQPTIVQQNMTGVEFDAFRS